MQIAFNSLRTLLFRVLYVVLGQILAIIIARWLGPDGNGLYTLALIFGTVGTTLMSGGAAAVAYEISNQGSDSHSAAANVAVLSLGLGIIPAIVGLAASPWLVAHGWWWLIPIAIAQPAILLSAALVGVFLGADEIKSLNYAYVGPWAAILAVFLFMTVIYGHTTQIALISWVVGQVWATLYSIWLARRLWQPLALSTVTRERLWRLLTFGVQAGLANLVGFLNYRADAIMVEAYLGQGPLGIYSVGVKTAEGLWFFSQAIMTASYARIGALSEADSARLAARGMRHSMFIIGLLAVFLLLIANPLLPLLYGGQYGGAVAPFRWLVPGIAFYGLASVLSAYYTNRLGRPKVALLIAGFSMLLNLGSCTVLIPALGLSGAAIASTLGYSVAIVAGVIAFRQSTHLGWREIVLINGEDLRDYLRFARKLFSMFRSMTAVADSG